MISDLDQIKKDMEKHEIFVNCVKSYISECRENKVTDVEIIDSFRRFLK